MAKTFLDIRPVQELSPEMIANLKKALVDAMYRDAMGVFDVKNEEELLVREMLPDKDLGLSAQEWLFDFSSTSIAVPTEKNILANAYTVPVNKLFGFLGNAIFTSGGTGVSTVKYKSGASELAIYDLSKLNAYRNKAGYYSNAILVRPRKNLEIDLYITVNQKEYIPFYAYVIETKGTTLNATPALQ